MADSKISALTSATEVDSADLLTIVQGGVNKKVAFSVVVSSLTGDVRYPAVANYAALPGAGTVAADTIYVVLAGSGVWPFNRKSAGLYVSNGVDTWTYLGPTPDIFKDSNFGVVNASDTTKIVQISAAGITTGTTRTLTAPDKNGTIAVLSDVVDIATIYCLAFARAARR